MAMREDVIASAVTFLQDPTVASSPLQTRIAFLQSKNLTQREVDAALARAGVDSAFTGSHAQQAFPPGYQQLPWKRRTYEAPQRDWRDWFIMATVVGGLGYGLYAAAKRYIFPVIAPPTEPQLEQDKQAIDESFERTFALLDQLAKDTEALKASEQSRAEHIDSALAGVDGVVTELKEAGRRREDDLRRINDEVRGLKELIPRAIEGQKETTDSRLKELNIEMKSLKTLLGQRMNAVQPTASAQNGTTYGTYEGPKEASSTSVTNEKPANPNAPTVPNANPLGSGSGLNSTPIAQARKSSPFNSGGRAAIPAWQLAASDRSEGGDERQV